MANLDPDQAANTDIQAVARVGAICALFAPQVSELTAAEIAERTGLNRTTAYRYCSSMAAAGILDRGSRRGTFALGGLMLEFGAVALGRRRVVEIAGPYLRRLRAAVRMTTVLGIRGAQGAVVALVEEDTSGPIVMTVHPGTRLDETAAQTQVFLAYSDPSSMEALTANLSGSAQTKLDAAVLAVRKHGYSLSRHGGSFGLAAPVFDQKALCATIAVLGADDSNLKPTIEQLLATANALSNELGATDEGPSGTDL